MKYIFVSIIILMLVSCKSNNSNRATKDAKKSSLTNTKQDSLAQNILDNGHRFIFSNMLQTYTFDASKPVKIVGKKGTVIRFKPNSFKNYKGMVSVQLIECYDIGSLLKLNLDTYTNDGMPLETKGMIFINAEDSLGNKLKLQKPMTIKKPFPKDRNVKLFYSKKTSYSDKPKWILSKQNHKRKQHNIKKQKDIIDFIWILPNGDTVNPNDKQGKKELAYYEANRQWYQPNFFSMNLGWINFDKYLRFPKNTRYNQKLIVENNIEGMQFYMIFYKFNLVSAASKIQTGRYEFKNIPVNQNVCLFGYKFINKKDIKLVVKKYKTSKHLKIKIHDDIQTLTLAEYKKKTTDLFGNNLQNRPSFN